jgi:hypothetical protein
MLYICGCGTRGDKTKCEENGGESGRHESWRGKMDVSSRLDQPYSLSGDNAQETSERETREEGAMARDKCKGGNNENMRT